MSADPRTLGWLNRALVHEMTAVQQYTAQSVLAGLWGEAEISARLKHEVLEELKHAEWIMERLMVLGVAPACGQTLPSRLGRDLNDLLQANRVLEVAAVRLYGEALVHARRVRDTEVATLFERILADEVAHLTEIDQHITERQHHD